MDEENKVVQMIRKADVASAMRRANHAVDDFLARLGGMTGVFQAHGYKVTVEKLGEAPTPAGRTEGE